MSNTNCLFLPEQIEIEINESRDNYLLRLYQILINDFKISQPLFKGFRVGWRRNPLVNAPGEVYHNREEAFHHLTTKEVDKKSKKREFDYERCKRVSWAKPVIVNYCCKRDCCTNRIVTWNDSKIKNRLKIFFPEERYIIILDKRKTMNAITQDYNEYYVLVTAYYIDIEHEYENYLKKIA